MAGYKILIILDDRDHVTDMKIVEEGTRVQDQGLDHLDEAILATDPEAGKQKFHIFYNFIFFHVFFVFFF